MVRPEVHIGKLGGRELRRVIRPEGDVCKCTRLQNLENAYLLEVRLREQANCEILE